mgnify:CR=1 FL=1
MEKSWITIGEVAARAGVATSALRFYEAIPELIAGFGILLKLPQSPAGTPP